MGKAFRVVNNSEKDWSKKHHEPNIKAKRLSTTSFNVLLDGRPYCIVETSPLVFWNSKHTEVISMDMNLQKRITNVIDAFSKF